MPDDTRSLIDSYDNVDWINAVRNELPGSEFANRIPEATQANIQETIQTLWTYRPLMNTFVDALINRIGLVLFVEWSWNNPLAPLKRGMLQYGETIEEIMVGLVEAEEYDPNRDALEKDLFGAKKPEVQASYHVVNRQNKYKITVKEPDLRKAFLTSNGLGNFVSQLMGSLTKSDQFDEYLAMANLFKEMERAATPDNGTSGLFNVHIDDIGDQDSTPEQSKFALRRMREFGTVLQFPSRVYNLAGMPQAINPDDLILFTTPQADAAMDVEALAAAFNINKAEVGYRKFVLPQEHYGIPGFQAALTTKEFFVVADQLINTTSMNNPSSLLTNYWLHHWQVLSASRFAPLVMFNSIRPSTTLSTTEYEVTSISAFTITDIDGNTQASELERGSVYNVEVEAVTTPTGGPNVAVKLSLDDNTSAFTKITNNGALVIGPDEKAQPLTIRATAVDDDNIPQLTATTTRALTGDILVVWPNPSVQVDSDNDGLVEVTPVEPDFTNNVITIPSVTGVQYKNGANSLNNGSTVDVASGSPVTITAVARSGYELASGATASWTFTFA